VESHDAMYNFTVIYLNETMTWIWCEILRHMNKIYGVYSKRNTISAAAAYIVQQKETINK
jgi:hypothetical protein